MRLEGAGRGNENITVDHVGERGVKQDDTYIFFAKLSKLWVRRIHITRFAQSSYYRWTKCIQPMDWRANKIPLKMLQTLNIPKDASDRFDRNFGTSWYNKNLKKSTISQMSKTFILHNNNTEKSLKIGKKNRPINPVFLISNNFFSKSKEIFYIFLRFINFLKFWKMNVMFWISDSFCNKISNGIQEFSGCLNQVSLSVSKKLKNSYGFWNGFFWLIF